MSVQSTSFHKQKAILPSIITKTDSRHLYNGVKDKPIAGDEHIPELKLMLLFPPSINSAIFLVFPPCSSKLVGSIFLFLEPTQSPVG